MLEEIVVMVLFMSFLVFLITIVILLRSDKRGVLAMSEHWLENKSQFWLDNFERFIGRVNYLILLIIVGTLIAAGFHEFCHAIGVIVVGFTLAGYGLAPGMFWTAFTALENQITNTKMLIVSAAGPLLGWLPGGLAALSEDPRFKVIGYQIILFNLQQLLPVEGLDGFAIALSLEGVTGISFLIWSVILFSVAVPVTLYVTYKIADVWLYPKRKLLPREWTGAIGLIWIVSLIASYLLNLLIALLVGA